MTDSRRGLRPGAGCPAPAAHWLARVWERTRRGIPTPRSRAALNSRAAADTRLVAEPGTRGRGAWETARPDCPRLGLARGRIMPADTPGKPRASPRAGASAGASRTPNQPRSVAEHRKVGTWPGVGWQERGGREGERGADARRTQRLPAPQSSKPVMEKRRRERINESLAQLQSLLLDALRKEVSWGWGRDRGAWNPGRPGLSAALTGPARRAPAARSWRRRTSWS